MSTIDDGYDTEAMAKIEAQTKKEVENMQKECYKHIENRLKETFVEVKGNIEEIEARYKS